MVRILCIIGLIAILFASCRSTRKLTTVVTPKDGTAAKELMSHEDSMLVIGETIQGLQRNLINFTTFSAKIEVDYQDGSGKNYDVTAHVRMMKDSVIWISIRALLGIEGLRAFITPDSVKLLDKQNNIYTARSVAYLQEVTALPLTLQSLQDLLIGNPVFVDSNIISYSRSENTITLLSIGDFFKNLFSLENGSLLLQGSKLDDLDELRNRTCYLGYSDYEDKKRVNFSTRRHIAVAEKKKLDIKLDFKQYDFNETLSFPFSVPKNYELK
ncbi:MAG TPA: DUF4292 domain-containing protein [Chitinophagaceae bacterium]|nr:DUF4292 domain-containing protein [Chitinophagaceae bacterium]